MQKALHITRVNPCGMFALIARKRVSTQRRQSVERNSAGPNPPEIGHFKLQPPEKADFCGLLWFLIEKNRVECG